MIKYYKYTQGTYKKVFLKVSTNPDDVDEHFKKFDLIAFDECSIERSYLAGPASISIESGFTSQNHIDKKFRLYKAEEISEEEYLDALVAIDAIKQRIDFVFKYL